MNEVFISGYGTYFMKLNHSMKYNKSSEKISFEK